MHIPNSFVAASCFKCRYVCLNIQDADMAIVTGLFLIVYQLTRLNGLKNQQMGSVISPDPNGAKSRWAKWFAEKKGWLSE